jgi:hypothetical protein
MGIFQDPYDNSTYISSVVSGQVSGGYLIGSGVGRGTVPNWSASSTNLASNFTATSITGLGYTQEKAGGSVARLQFSSDGSNIKAADNSDLKIGSYIFDGVDDYIEVPDDSSILNLPQGGGFTCSAWIYPRTIGEGGQGEIFNKGAYDFIFILYQESNGKAKVMIQHDCVAGNNYNVQSDEGQVKYNEWNHIVFKMDGDESTLATVFVNGQEVAVSFVTAGGGDFSSDVGTLKIGAADTGGAYAFDGLISDLIWWPSELTDAQCQNIFLEGSIPAGYAARWKFDGNANDSSANGNNGTVSQAVSSTRKPNVGFQLAGTDTCYFDGVNDNLALTGYNSGIAYSGNTTISAWIKVEDFGGTWTDQPIFSRWWYKIDGSSTIKGGMGIGLFKNRFYMANWTPETAGTYWAADSNSVVIDNRNQWYHVVGVFNSGSYSLSAMNAGACPMYVNGEEVAQGAFYYGGGPALSDINGYAGEADVQIGGGDEAGYFYGTAKYFGGNIANLCFFESGLSSAEVVELYENGSPDMTNPSLKGYWPLQGTYDNVVEPWGPAGYETSGLYIRNATNSGTIMVADAYRPASGIPSGVGGQKIIDVTGLSLTSSFYYNHVVSNNITGFGGRLSEISLLYTEGGGGGGAANTNLITAGDPLVSNVSFSTVSGNAVIIDSRSKFGVRILGMNSAFDCTLRKDTAGGDVISYVPAGNTRLRASIPIADGTNVYLHGDSNTTLTYTWKHSPSA